MCIIRYLSFSKILMAIGENGVNLVHAMLPVEMERNREAETVIIHNRKETEMTVMDMQLILLIAMKGHAQRVIIF